MAEIPPWLRAPDIAGEYARGVQIGSSIAEANARLSEEAQQAQMATQARAQQLEREHQIDTQKLAQDKAYHDAQIGVRAAALDNAAKVNAVKTGLVAQQFARQQNFNNLVQKYQAAGLSNSEATSRAMFESGTATPQLAETAAENEIKAKEFAQRQADAKAAAQQKGVARLPTIDITPADAATGAGAKMKFFQVPVNDPRIPTLLGTNALSALGTNWQAGAVLPGQVPNEGNPQPSPQPLPAPSSPASARAAAPYPEGTILRSKKTRKQYRVENGQPVEIQDSDAK